MNIKIKFSNYNYYYVNSYSNENSKSWVHLKVLIYRAGLKNCQKIEKLLYLEALLYKVWRLT